MAWFTVTNPNHSLILWFCDMYPGLLWGLDQPEQKSTE